jgi:hypothetical protein
MSAVLKRTGIAGKVLHSRKTMADQKDDREWAAKSRRSRALATVAGIWARDGQARKAWAVKNPATDPVLAVKNRVSREPN